MIEAGHQLLRIVSEGLDVGSRVATIRAPRGRNAPCVETPLATVQGLAYLLIEEHQGTAICDDLRRIDAAAIRLAKVSDSLEHVYRARLQAAQDESLPACSTAPPCIRRAGGDPRGRLARAAA